MTFSPRLPTQMWHLDRPTAIGVWIWSREKYPDNPPLPEFEGIAVCNCRTCNVYNLRVFRASSDEMRTSDSGVNSLREWIAYHRLPIPASLPAVEMCVDCEARAVSGTLITLAIRPDGRNSRLCNQCANSGRYYSTTLNEQTNGNAVRWVPRTSCVLVVDQSTYATLAYATAYCYYSESEEAWFTSAALADTHIRQRTLERSTLMEHAVRGYVWGYHELNNIQAFGWPKETPKASLCFGVELEMEHRRSNTQEGQAALSSALGGRIGAPPHRYLLARDGSLNASGVELITNPYTLEFHQNEFDWQATLANVVKIGRAGQGTETCGMHVHCNRKAISALQLGKALVLINSPKNKPLVTRVAQRDSNTYTQLRAKKISDGRIISTGKYEAMHLSQETIEFRIFKSNLRWDRVLKNIEFCHSVLMFAKSASNKECEDFGAYLSYIVSKAKTYPHLIAFLREKDTIAIRKGAPQVQIQDEV